MNGKVIVLCNQKGGVGKTTIALHLAVALADDGLKVCFIDADGQKAALNWYLARASWKAEKGERVNFTLLSKNYEAMDESAVRDDVCKLKKHHDCLVIDTPGVVGEATMKIMAAADLLLIPLPPGAFDLWGSKTTRDYAVKLVGTGKVEARIILNRLRNNPELIKRTREAVAADEPNIPVMKNKMSDRVAYERCADGKTVFELEAAAEAYREMLFLLKETREVIDI